MSGNTRIVVSALGSTQWTGSYKDQGLTTGRLGRLDEIHWLHEVPLAGKHRRGVSEG